MRADDGAPEIVIITGMSGAGRSTAAKSLEDLDWFVADNLPPGMLYGLSVNPQFQTTLYVIEPGGAHRSDDGGVTWWP